MKSIYSFCLAFLVLLGFTESVFSQQNCSSSINLQNPSFEGNPGSASPPSWSSSSCTWGPNVMNSSSSTNESGTRLSSSPLAAFDGSTYLGMSYNSSQGGQVIWQQLSSPFVAGTTYTTSIELAVPTVTTGDDPYKYYYSQTCGGINVYGGNSPCSLDQLLWSSGQISNTNWQNFPISFTPSQNWTYLIIVSTGCGYNYTNYNQSSITLVDTIAPLSTNFNLAANTDRNNLCSSDSAGQASVHVTSGAAPTGFTWSSNPVQHDSVLKNVPAGTYTVTVTSANQLCATASVTISAPSPVNANANANTNKCFTIGAGSVSATASGGTSPYQFIWNTGANSSTVNNLFSGTYKVTVSDAYNCKAITSVTVDSAGPMNVNAFSKPAACPNYNNGYLIADQAGGTPGYKYQWSTTPPSGSSEVDNLIPGSYTVTVTDGHSCTASATFSVEQTAPADNLTVDNAISCNGHTINGKITANASGGTGPYTYAWNTNPQQTTSFAVNVAPGNYSVTITDNAGCSLIDNATIELNGGLSINPSSSNSTCGSNGSGFAVANASGSSSYHYHWNTGATSDTIMGIDAGHYQVTVTGSTGCSVTGAVTVNQSGGNQVVNITSQTETMCAGDSAYVCITSPIDSTTQILWSNGSTGYCAYTQYAGGFWCNITDHSGCTTQSNHVNINVFPNPPVAISGNGDTLRSYSAVTYQWYENGVIIQNATSYQYIATEPGAYTVEVTDTNACHQISIPYYYEELGISGINGDTWVRVYPNPSTNGAWQLQAGNNMIGSSIEVYDDNGRLVHKSQIHSLNSQLNLDVAKGIYLMQVISPYKTFNLKLTRL